jgi:DNA-binding NtrC family response regulator
VKGQTPQSEQAEGTEPKPAAVPAPSGGGEAVLVVEDESRVRNVTVARLTSLGYRVLEASSGTAAMEVLGDHPEIEILFSDLVLPGELSGLDLAKRVQEIHPNVHVILTSGYSAELMSGWGEELDLQVLPKPYRQADLARIFRDALQARLPRAGSGKADGSA